MKTLRKVEIEPIWCDLIPDELEQNKVYISLEYKSSVHLCLCGCGNLVVTPLNKDGWVLSNINNKITITPSILNNNCPNKSHYILTKNIANFV